MGILKAPPNTPVWTIEERCKSCDICVDFCPAGVLVMKKNPNTFLGKTIEVAFPSSCIGCRNCEDHCPDFCIFVAERSEFQFAKLTDEAKARKERIRANNFMKLEGEE